MNHRSNDLSALKTKILVIEAARRAISIPMTGASFLIILCFSFYRLTYFTEIKKNGAMDSCTTQLIFMFRLQWLFRVGTVSNNSPSKRKDRTCYLNEPSSPISLSPTSEHVSTHSNFHDSDPILIMSHSLVRQMVHSYTIIIL
jgi:hypothetical protein